ncbi:hypothetical protein [Cryobacterium sp. PH31-L1]|uniref:hypothetical protein n=1 Tax=Cryobacterium sp. PH31-L1 TaxID=3046199 RepID=UPI0024BBDBD4|nr:hypothetical protein [Cryobacterium sp. PH31-L1]MDJ0376022.1 hypothetical protein [Cryobacterium sp. PH31-L1]
MSKTQLTWAADRGSSMLAVIGLMAVAGVATLAIAGSTMNSIGVSSATRAGVQAQAAAEAGIDDALLKLRTAPCNAATLGTSAPLPVARVTISHWPSAIGSWGEGCPVGDAVKQVKIVSTGNAIQNGQAGNSTGDTRTVEVVYNYESKTVAIPAIGAGTAIYSYALAGIGGSSKLYWDGHRATPSTLIDQAATRPVVQVKTGNSTCASPTAASSIFEADFVVEEGTFTAAGSCQIYGNVWAKQDTTTDGSAILWGNLATAGLSTAGSSQIYGNVWASSDPVKSGTSIIHGTVSGAAAAPPAPTVPDWVDIAPYDAKTNDWPDHEITILKKNNDCDVAAIEKEIKQFKNPGNPNYEGLGIIDASICENGINLDITTKTLELPRDLVIYAKKFTMGLDGQIGSDSATVRKLWLITSDETVDKKPTCIDQHDASVISNSFIVKPTVTAMLYTPCGIVLGAGDPPSAQWTGQLYGGNVTVTGSAQLRYEPVGIPGTEILAGGAPGHAAREAKLGDRLSIRDLNG